MSAFYPPCRSPFPHGVTGVAEEASLTTVVPLETDADIMVGAVWTPPTREVADGSIRRLWDIDNGVSVAT